jgi:uncharacterized protein (TIGR03118 family)
MLKASSKLFVVFATILFLAGCQKNHSLSQNGSNSDLSSTLKSGKKIGHFTQTNLVTDLPGQAAQTDPMLLNAWGLTWAPSGIAWIGSEVGHVSNVYDREGHTVLGPVTIPSQTATTGGHPSGVTFNSSTGFPLATGGPARFIFAGTDGVISAWNGAQGTHAARIATIPLTAFTGLTIAHNGTDTLLYAANFEARMINVWNKAWAPVSLPFMDPMIPAGFSPFNIQNIGNMLYVTYAKVASNGDSQEGEGLGYVDIYNPDGTLVKRFASKGSLDAPWGVAMAPANYLTNEVEDEDDVKAQPSILVGNFGNGRINAYSLNGKFLGQLRGASHQILTIDGLWAIMFPPTTSTIDQRRLYFTAGPDDETHGLFGYLLPAPTDLDDHD